MPQVLPGILGGIGSLAGGLLGGPSQKSTSTQTPIWAPGQENLMQQLFSQYLQALGMGPGVTQGDRNALMTQINNSYAGMKPQLESELTARGFGQSGKLGQGFRQIDEARVGSQQQGEAGLQSQAMQRWLALLGMGPNLIRPVGSTTTSTGTQSPGFGATIGNAISPLGAALAINNPFLPSSTSGTSASGGPASGSITPGTPGGQDFGSAGSFSPPPASSMSLPGGESFTLPPPQAPGSQPASGYLAT